MIGGAGGAGRVLDNDGLRRQGGPQRIHVSAEAEQVDRDRCLGPVGDRLANLVGVNVVGVGADIHEDGPRSHMLDDVGGRDPGERRDDHLVAGADARGDQSEMQGRGAGGDGQGVRNSVPISPLISRGAKRGSASARPASAVNATEATRM